MNLKKIFFTKNINFSRTSLLRLVVAGIVAMTVQSCGDPAPTAFIPETTVEAFLIVNNPISIKIYRTQSVEPNSVFNYANQISDAKNAVEQAVIEELDDQNTIVQTIPLQFRPRVIAPNPETGFDSLQGDWFNPQVVKPLTTYRLRITMKNDVGGGEAIGTTTTPAVLVVNERIQKVLQYPKESSLPAGPTISWTVAPLKNGSEIIEFPLSVRCLDTLNYGKYLAPETSELNARTNNLKQFEDSTNKAIWLTTTRWGFVQSTSVKTIFTAFKWFGKNEFSLYAPDKNFLDWYKATQFAGRRSYNPTFASVNGAAKGVFASASVYRDTCLIIKP